VRAVQGSDLSALLEYTLERKRKGYAEPKEMHVVAQLALRSKDSALHAKAMSLRAEAARNGDVRRLPDLLAKGAAKALEHCATESIGRVP
jgi:hypothetical protein